MLIYLFKYFVIIYLFFNCISLVAGEVKDLYSAKVLVASQGKNDRTRALRSAMRAVLLKVGGHESVLSDANIKSQLPRVNAFVSNYSFETIGDKTYLQASFQDTKINNLFVASNLPIWGSLRPQVIIWFVDEQGLSRQIISASSPSAFPDIIRDFSNQRGLPMVLPLVDLDDISQISLTDLWGRFLEPIHTASKRYTPDVIVTIRLSNSSLLPSALVDMDCQLLCQQMYVLDWSVIANVNDELLQQFGRQYQGREPKKLLLSALDDITNKMYETYALSTASTKQYLIDVTNIDSLSTYVKVNEFLQSLTSVRSVNLISAHANQRRFRLSLLGSEQAFLASLKLNNKLTQYQDPLAIVEPEDIPTFLWHK